MYSDDMFGVAQIATARSKADALRASVEVLISEVAALEPKISDRGVAAKVLERVEKIEALMEELKELGQ